MPLNIDWQQILLHWMNLAILTGGLYFLLFKPVKQFMEKREAYYRERDEEAAGKSRAKAQQSVQQSAEEQLSRVQAQAQQILTHARAEAEHDREEILRSSQRELRKLASEATKRLALERDPFDQFLDLAEEGVKHEER